MSSVVSFHVVKMSLVLICCQFLWDCLDLLHASCLLNLDSNNVPDALLFCFSGLLTSIHANSLARFFELYHLVLFCALISHKMHACPFFLICCNPTITACRYLSDRRAKCISRFWTANSCCQSDQEVYSSCKENGFCCWAWFHHGNLSCRQSYCICGSTINWLYCKFSTIIVVWDEPFLIGEFHTFPLLFSFRSIGPFAYKCIIYINVFLHLCSILISHLEGTQLIFVQGSTNSIQPRTENKSLLGLIITLMTDSILILRLVRPCALFSLECFTWQMETDYIVVLQLFFHQYNIASVWAFMGSQI